MTRHGVRTTDSLVGHVLQGRANQLTQTRDGETGWCPAFAVQICATVATEATQMLSVLDIFITSPSMQNFPCMRFVHHGSSSATKRRVAHSVTSRSKWNRLVELSTRNRRVRTPVCEGFPNWRTIIHNSGLPTKSWVTFSTVAKPTVTQANYHGRINKYISNSKRGKHVTVSRIISNNKKTGAKMKLYSVTK